MNITFETIRKNAEEHIETCNLLTSRVVDAWCCALPDTGEVLCKDGIRPMPTDFGAKVERSGSKVRAATFLRRIKEANPDNPTVQRLELMGWKRAARIGADRSRALLRDLEERGL